jgi:hypothetical protein
LGLGSLALTSVLNDNLFADDDGPLASNKPHFPAKAESVIDLHMAEAPSCLDLIDPKPKLNELNELNGETCPGSPLVASRSSWF